MSLTYAGHCHVPFAACSVLLPLAAAGCIPENINGVIIFKHSAFTLSSSSYNHSSNLQTYFYLDKHLFVVCKEFFLGHKINCHELDRNPNLSKLGQPNHKINGVCFTLQV